MKKRGFVILISLIAVLLIISGCETQNFNNKITNFKDSLGLNLFSGSAVSCSSDTDCEIGYICEGGSCKLGCLEDSECPGTECDLDTGRCVVKGECTSDRDCSSGRCDLANQKCVECLWQQDCKDDFICNLETNKCEAQKEPEPIPLVEPEEPEEVKRCTDTDGGKDYFVKGIITIGTSTIEEECWDEKNIKERYCGVDNLSVLSDVHECPNGCEDGACLTEPAEPVVNITNVTETKPAETVKEITCTDSDEENKYEKGTITSIILTKKGEELVDKKEISITDACLEKDGKHYVTEGICKEFEGMQINSVKELECEFGCKDGVCIEQAEATCTDPDGDDISKATTLTYKDATGAEKSFNDKCIGLVGVFEGICTEEEKFACINEDGTENSECRRRCPKGQVCKNGACEQSTAQCIDTDGENKNKYGTVTYTNIINNAQLTMEDSCITWRFAREAVCNSLNQGRIKILKCGKDEACISGRCIPSQQKCTDSDGRDRTNKGITDHVGVAGVPGKHTDICFYKTHLWEGMCKLNTFIVRKVPCPKGTTCHDGACIKGEPTTILTCKDTDSYNIYTVGTITYTDSEGKHTKTDSCFNKRYVNENYCYRNIARESKRFCTRWCVGGKCIE